MRDDQLRKEYQDYLNSIRVGDTVFPCYGGKVSKSARCKVVGITEGCIHVEGLPKVTTSHGLVSEFDRSTGECCVGNLVQGEDQQPTKEYYSLVDIQGSVRKGYFRGERYSNYLKELGVEV